MELLTIPQAAAEAERHTSSIHRWIQHGVLAAVKQNGRTLIPRESLDALLEPQPVNDAARELLARTRAASGVPETIEDDTTIARIAEILKGGAADATA